MLYIVTIFLFMVSAGQGRSGDQLYRYSPKQQKTGNHIIIPVRPIAGNTGQIQKSGPKSYEQSIKTHTARRSGATNMYLAGIPTIAIMKITGHKTEKEFMEEQTTMELVNHPYFSGIGNTIEH